jgi:hypothetical protein
MISTFIKQLSLAFFIIYLMSSSCLGGTPEPVDARLARILGAASSADRPGKRIVTLSSQFLGAPYAANTLVGGPDVPERLVAGLDAFDCFTLLDTVEALRRSSSAGDFLGQLQLVRYRQGVVAYGERRHFFSDWVADQDSLLIDVTAQVAQGRARPVIKELNRRDDGTLWLAGIAVTRRDIYYIPAEVIDQPLLSALQPGDYVGIYSELAGLDVSHTGLIVKNANRIMLRHASSRRGVERVVDDDLSSYLQGKPGLVVYRVKP